MANNLRYLLEHFCLDGQTIDISSKLDEENAKKIEKINTETVPSINARIDEIKNTDIPNINSRIDGIKNTDIPSINQKINSINNISIPTLDRRITGVDDKVDSTNVKVEKNSKDIATLSDNVTSQGNDINSINTEKIPTIENKIESANKKIADNTSKINEIKNTDIPNLTQRVSDNETNIEGVTQNVNDLANNVIPPIKEDVDGLTTKVNANTGSINTINNTSIPNLQNQIDSLSSGGSGSIEDLREKVQTNTNDISALKVKVDKNTSDISVINDTSIPNLQNQIDNFNVGTWAKVYEKTLESQSATITQYFNEKLKLACMTVQFNTSGGSWVDRGHGFSWEIGNLHNPLTNVSGIIRLVSGVHYICGILNVSKDNRINGTLIEAMPSRDLDGNYVLYGSVLYPTD